MLAFVFLISTKMILKVFFVWGHKFLITGRNYDCEVKLKYNKKIIINVLRGLITIDNINNKNEIKI